MAPIAPDVVSFEHAGPQQYAGLDAVREVCRAGLAASAGPIEWDMPELRVDVDGDLAVAYGIDRIRTPEGAEYLSRATRVFRRAGGHWRVVHQHLSFPQ